MIPSYRHQQSVNRHAGIQTRPGLSLGPYFTFGLSLLLVFVLGLRVFSVPLFSLPPQKPTFQITI